MDTTKNKSNTNKRSIGMLGEKTAERYLSQRGLTLIERNFNSRYGEIDLIMMHNNCIVFIEVRQRKNTVYGSPIETVNWSKQRKLKRTAEYYCLCRNVSTHFDQRFDIVGIVSGTGKNTIEWVSDAF